MFLGLRTLIYKIKSEDLGKAKLWYSKLLDRQPYFDQPFYVGFNLGGFELGLDPNGTTVKVGDNVETYLGVSNIETALAHCLKNEARLHSEIREVGEGIKVATVQDPFGNIVGLIQNSNFKIET
jgi:predicted enzyme related to lactoylglutathione lyase